MKRKTELKEKENHQNESNNQSNILLWQTIKFTDPTRLRSTQEGGGSSCPRLSPGRRLCLKQSCHSTHHRTVVDAHDQSLIPTAQGGRVATHGVDPHMYGVSRVDPALNRSPSQQVDHKHAQYLLTDRFSPPQLRLGLRVHECIPVLPREEGTASL